MWTQSSFCSARLAADAGDHSEEVSPASSKEPEDDDMVRKILHKTIFILQKRRENINEFNNPFLI